MKNKKKLTVAAILRQKAEEKLRLQQTQSGSISDDSQLLKKVYDLESHKFKLQLLTEELILAKDNSKLAEEKNTQFFDFAPIGIISLTKEGQIKELNFMAAGMLGKNRKELINNRVGEFISADTLQNFNGMLYKAYKSRKRECADVSISANESINVKISCIVYESTGEYLLSMVDQTAFITSSHKEVLLHEVLENSSDAFYKRNLTTNSYDYLSPVYTTITGYTNQEMLNLPLDEILNLVHPDDYDIPLSAITAALKKDDQKFHEVIYRFRHKSDGEYRWIRDRYRMQYDMQGEPISIIGSLSDVSLQKKAEIALQESKDYLDKIINLVASPIFVKNEKHEFQLVNNAFCKLLNLPAEKIIGHNDFEYVTKEQKDVFIKVDKEVFETGREIVNEEFITDGNGKVRTIITTKTLFTDKSDNKFLVGVINDITDVKKPCN